MRVSRGAESAPGRSPGPGVDRDGTPVIDPTKNVDALVEAAIKRQDDLRTSETQHVRELLETRFAYEEKLRDKESARLDAIRAVDVASVESARVVAEVRANTLATQQQQSAEALRSQVEGARIATATALAQALAPIIKSVEDLRAAQYQQQGEKSSRTETSVDSRDALAIEQARIMAANSRMQMYALIIAAIVLALGVYAAFHK